jgi:hypothetical protein
MNEKECLASGGHRWGSPIAIVNPPEFRISCEKCHRVEVVKPKKEEPSKKRNISITWRDWFKSARHIGSTQI